MKTVGETETSVDCSPFHKLPSLKDHTLQTHLQEKHESRKLRSSTALFYEVVGL